MVVQLSQPVQERFNVLMRPAREVPKCAVPAGILRAMGDLRNEEERDAALAYVFANYTFAGWSGPPTPASQYPEPLRLERGEPDWVTLDRIFSDGKIQRALNLLMAQIEAEQLPVGERAKRARTFLNDVPLIARIPLLGVMLDSSAFLRTADRPKEIGDDTAMPSEACAAILWKHRDVMFQIRGAFQYTQARHTAAALIDQAIRTIENDRERSVVLSAAMQERMNADVRSFGRGLEMLAVLLGDD